MDEILNKRGERVKNFSGILRRRKDNINHQDIEEPKLSGEFFGELLAYQNCDQEKLKKGAWHIEFLNLNHEVFVVSLYFQVFLLVCCLINLNHKVFVVFLYFQKEMPIHCSLGIIFNPVPEKH